MVAVLVFAVLLSEVAQRSILSTAVLFLVAGFIGGAGLLQLLPSSPENPVTTRLAEFALVSVLFTDGMRVGLDELVAAWHLPGRALLLGMPLTFLGTALVGTMVVGLPWAEAFLLAAVLSPTDPVFAAAIVGRREVPASVRHLLNVESGLNDGLALPVVIAMLAVVGKRDAHMGTILSEVGLGIALGAALPWIALRLEHLCFLAASGLYQPLYGFAIGLLVLAIASLTHANEFLAAFTAGITVSTVRPQIQEHFHDFGELITELLKLAALLIFGAVVSLTWLHSDLHFHAYLFTTLVLLAVRPVALLLALLGSSLSWPERLTVAWFGPKGFASALFGLMVLRPGAPEAQRLFELTALVIVASIVLMAQWFAKPAAPARQHPKVCDKQGHENS